MFFRKKNNNRLQEGQSRREPDGSTEYGEGRQSSLNGLNQSNGSNHNRSEDRLLGANHTAIDLIDDVTLNINETQNKLDSGQDGDEDQENTSKESDSFLTSRGKNTKITRDQTNRTATLARAETIDEDNATPRSIKGNPFIYKSHNHQPSYNNNNNNQSSKQQTASSGDGKQQQSCTCTMFCRMLHNKSPILIPLLILSCMAAIYCIPFVDVQPRTPKRLPNIPFNFRDGPLRPSNASQFKAERLFYDQIHGAESIALDSMGNMFMAIEGGFILYAHLNASSTPNKAFAAAYQSYSVATSTTDQSQNINKQPSINSDNISQQKSVIDAQAAAMLKQYLISARSFQLGPMVNMRLFRIAELNPIKQLTLEQRRREGISDFSSDSSWRRECQLDEHVYGRQLWSMQTPNLIQNTSPSIPSNQRPQDESLNTEGNIYQSYQQPKFYSRVVMSRCSKPLGLRLSPDENFLYVIDTLTGLFKVHLKVPERPNSSLKLVTKLIDFKNQRYHLLPVTFLDLAAGQVVKSQPSSATASQSLSNSVVRNIRQIGHSTNADALLNDDELLMGAPNMKVRAYLNTSLMAVDDLVIDHGAGSRGGDMIYMTVASQKWLAVAFLYDYLEGRPSGAIIRFDTGANQLSVLSPHQISHVRTSMTGQQLYNEDQTIFQWFNEDENNNYNNNYYHLNNVNNDQPQTHIPQITTTTAATYVDRSSYESTIPTINDIDNDLRLNNLFGVPRLDENDIFDDRPLHFPNGLELTDDRQALLIADTANKRIIKHFIRGSRKGTSDLWAWTPHFPDNIRRGYDKLTETYWVAGCGEDTSEKFDIMPWLHSWPRFRKYLLKNVYLFGWIIESIGSNIVKSTRIRDFGFSIRNGHSLCESMCSGMMILQYDANGKLIRSIYGREFPSGLSYFSQVNEVIDKQTHQHYLYLSSPGYNYVTKLYLPQLQDTHATSS